MNTAAKSKSKASEATKGALSYPCFTESQIKDLLVQCIDFIPNSDFKDVVSSNLATAEKSEVWQLVLEQDPDGAPDDLPAHLRRICAVDLLTSEQERELFREMNQLKYQASQLQSSIDCDNPDMEAVGQLSDLMRNANAIRDHIIQANTRLVISIVKKFVTPQQSFDDILSDGIFTLMQAVEKFDFDRGFRFSTYAYRSIARNAFRTVQAAQKEEARVTRDAEDWAFGEEDTTANLLNDRIWGNLSELMNSLVTRLDRRERFIIRSRYALGSHRKKQTFQFLANKLGVSKERARQLEKRAVEKLQNMAAEFEIDEFSGAVV